MASAYGNTLTDLGRNIAEQKASERALAGILAQVGAQKLAALNALAANRGRTQAERDVGMDRNATQRQVAVMESMLRAQELGDRDRQYREGLSAAETLARLEGSNRLAVAGVPYGPEARGMRTQEIADRENLAKIEAANRLAVAGVPYGPDALRHAESLEKMRGRTNLDVAQTPYGPDALKMAETLARIQSQALNPRMAETMFMENAERERMNLRAQSLATDANRQANLLYQELVNKKSSWRPLWIGDSDKKLDADYQSGINNLMRNYGDDAALLRPITQPDGRVTFQPLSMPMIRQQVPQVPTANGTTNGVPSGASGGWQPNMGVPTVDIRENALRMARELKGLGLSDDEIRNRVYAAYPQIVGAF